MLHSFYFNFANCIFIFVSVEQHYLIHWVEENKVSIHKASEIYLDLEDSSVAYVKFKCWKNS